jgi:hypothetical protein
VILVCGGLKFTSLVAHYPHADGELIFTIFFMCFSNLYLIFIDIKINSSCEGETDIIASIILRV